MRFAKLAVLNVIVKMFVIPVFYNPDLEVAKKIIEAIYNAGCRIAEFTNRGDHAWEVFSALEKWCAGKYPDMMLGVGSVVDCETAIIYINCGACFVVGPTADERIARACHRRGVPYVPGCSDANQMLEALEWGCFFVKFFPGDIEGGPDFVEAMLAPCPWVPVIPTGGAEPTEESLGKWMKAGVVAVGIGSKLISKALIENGDWDGLTAKVRDTLVIVAGLRSKK